MSWYLYILKCRDDSFYTGITKNLKRRINEHNLGVGAKSLLGKRPVKLVYTEIFSSQRKAAKREKAVKAWKKEYKLKLILNNKGSPFKGVYP